MMHGHWTKLFLSVGLWLLWSSLGHAEPRILRRDVPQRHDDHVRPQGAENVQAPAQEDVNDLDLEVLALDPEPPTYPLLQPPPKYVYIASTDTLDTIRLRGGFPPENLSPSTNDDFSLDGHMTGRTNSPYVTTYLNAEDAVRSLGQARGFLYKIKSSKNMIEVDHSLQLMPMQNVFATLGGLRYEQIVEMEQIVDGARQPVTEQPQHYNDYYEDQMTRGPVPQLAGWVAGAPQWNQMPWSMYEPTDLIGTAEYTMNSVGHAVGFRGRYPLWDIPDPEAAKVVLKAADRILTEIVQASRDVIASETPEQVKAATDNAKLALERAVQTVKENSFLGRYHFDQAVKLEDGVRTAALRVENEMRAGAADGHRKDAEMLRDEAAREADASKLAQMSDRAKTAVKEILKLKVASATKLRDLQQRLGQLQEAYSQLRASVIQPDTELPIDTGLTWLPDWETRAWGRLQEMERLQPLVEAQTAADQGLAQVLAAAKGAAEAVEKAAKEAKEREAESKQVMEQLQQATGGSDMGNSAGAVVAGAAAVGVVSTVLGLGATWSTIKVAAGQAAAQATAGMSSGALRDRLGARAARREARRLLRQRRVDVANLEPAEAATQIQQTVARSTRQRVAEALREQSTATDREPLLERRQLQTRDASPSSFWQDVALFEALRGGAAGFRKASEALQVN